jgi:hypothetical protein
MVMMAACGPFYYPWSVVLSRVIARNEGQMGVLASIERVGGLLTGVVTMVPGIIWLVAALRIEDRSPELTQFTYDLGWIFFDLTWVCSWIQMVALGVAILRDRRARPLIPSWVAWVAFLTGACYMPLVFVPFFETGPFAWHGLINFWVVFVMFFVLIAVVTPYVWRALRVLEAEALEDARTP